MIKLFTILFLFIFNGITMLAQKTNLDKTSKKRSGLYVFNDQIKQIFPEASISYSKKTIITELENKSYTNATYIIIVRNFHPTKKDLSAIADFLSNGNNVLILSNWYSVQTQDFFKFKSTSYILEADSNSIQFTKKIQENFNDSIYSNYTKKLYSYLDSFNVNKSTVMGTNDNNTANFIKMKFGSGNLYLHLYPQVVTNGFLLEKGKQNFTYTETLLSCLPKYTNNIIVRTPNWYGDSYNGEAGKNENSLMKYIWNNPNLKAAMLVAIGAFVLLVLFGLKRMQKRIPIKEPIENKTLDFAKTIGDLYFNYKNNMDIAYKKIQYWREHIRTKYQIPTNKMDKDFWDKLQKKSGADNAFITQLETKINFVHNNYNITDKQLIALSNQIDQFYKL